MLRWFGKWTEWLSKSAWSPVKMQTRRKGVESVCVRQLCEDHPALVWRRIHILQNICRSSQEQADQKGDGSASLVTITRKVSVCATSWGLRKLVSEICQANWGNCRCSPDTRRDRSWSKSVWHPHCCSAPASRTRRESQGNNSCSGAIGPPAAIAQRWWCAVGCKKRNTLSKQQEMKLIFRGRRFAEWARGTKQMSGVLQCSSPLASSPLEQ